MRTNACALLLAACCLRAAGAQRESEVEGTNVWREPIRFKTKAADSCAMAVTGHGDVTRLRVTCVAARHAHHYWCEYEGKPHACRNYNLNPRHYFTQMMWGLRKLQNACRAPRAIKPQMCRRATDDAQMAFSASSSSSAHPASTGRLATPDPATDDDGMKRGTHRPLRRPPPARERVPQTQKPSPSEPTPAPVESRARALARHYCWKSFHGLCATVIGWFPH